MSAAGNTLTATEYKYCFAGWGTFESSGQTLDANVRWQIRLLMVQNRGLQTGGPSQASSRRNV
jgi:hypothetical protein